MSFKKISVIDFVMNSQHFDFEIDSIDVDDHDQIFSTLNSIIEEFRVQFNVTNTRLIMTT